VGTARQVELCCIYHEDNDDSEKNTIKRSATVLRVATSRSLSSYTTAILSGWKFRSLCKILLTLGSDIPRATEYLLAERLEQLMNDCLTTSMFCGDRTARTLAVVSFLMRKRSFSSFLPTSDGIAARNFSVTSCIEMLAKILVAF
jgi:hypothetical protein